MTAVAQISAARKAAFQILLAVERGKAHADDLLRGKAVSALAPVDRHLATTLVLGVLRWQIHLDHELRPLLKRPGAKLDPEVLIALRLGAFQLLHLDRVPAHAAIGESVELAKQAGQRFASGMVNALLRKLASSHKDAAASMRALVSDGEISEGGLVLGYAHPSWMVERWASFYGLEAARAICEHGQSQPSLTVRVTSPDVEAELVQAGIQLAPGELLTSARTVVSGDVTATAAFQAGRVRFQDEGSQLIAEIAAYASDHLNQEAASVLDTCAAPGGKTLILAERNPEARIVACEASPQRLAELRKRLAVLANRVECRLADATTLAEDSLFDLALVDVPCSGTGTLGRNPEIRHRLRPDDFARHAERQRAILRGALRAVRTGGRVVYSTCSLEPEENEQVIAAVLAESPNAGAISLRERIETLQRAGVLTPSGAEQLQSRLTPEGTLRLLPGVLHTDGFYIALLEKTV